MKYPNLQIEENITLYTAMEGTSTAAIFLAIALCYADACSNTERPGRAVHAFKHYLDIVFSMSRFSRAHIQMAKKLYHYSMNMEKIELLDDAGVGTGFNTTFPEEVKELSTKFTQPFINTKKLTDGAGKYIASSYFFRTKKVRDRFSNRESNYVGQRGDKYSDVVRLYEKMYIYLKDLHIAKWQDKHGNILTTFFSQIGDVLPYEKGAWFRLKGSISKHQEYQGVKQTTISSVKLYTINALEYADLVLGFGTCLNIPAKDLKDAL